jgi:5-methylcytosine-specific restriction endonuclease McrA
VPLSKGGRHERSNMATAHFRCNCVKNDRLEGIA